MSNFITDGDFMTAQPVSDIRDIAPFSDLGINTILVIDQDFVINRTNFAPLAIDSTHPTLAGYFLARETDPVAVSINDTVKWTRRYAQVPSSFSRPGGTYPYTFPVMYTGINSTSRLFAKPFSVNSRIQYDFFHTPDPNSITIIEPQRYVIATNPTIDATSPWGEPVVTNAGFSVTPTIPTLDTYNAWIAAGVEVVPEASKITPNWMGNIHMRETIYVKAH